MPSLLLTRDNFRESVFQRDAHKCVVCGVASTESQLDAHHIIERRLFPDGGYYIDNGATLCSEHHMLAEQTVLSCDEIRSLCGIHRVVLPPHLYDDLAYDKWSNIILQNGTRLRGELFYDESVQKVLKEGNMLDLFSPYVKHQRTHHLPWSNPTKATCNKNRITFSESYIKIIYLYMHLFCVF